MAYGDTILAESSLVSFWRPGASLNDLKGANNGTATGSPASGVTSFDGLSDAMTFNGSSQYVSVPDAANLDLTGGLTVEAWCKLTSAPRGSAYSRMVAKPYTSNSSPFTAYGLIAENGSSRFQFELAVGGNQTAAGSTTPVAGRWYHVVGTYDGSTQKLYVNGVLEDSPARTGAVGNYATPFGIGAGVFPGAVANYFPGAVDAVAVYNSALPASSVVRHFAAGFFGGGTGGRTSGDGAAASLSFGAANPPLFGATNSLVCCWIKAATLAGMAGAQPFFSQAFSTSRGWVLCRSGSADLAQYHECNGNFPSAGALTGSGWVHLAGLHDAGDGKFHLYVNGVDSASAANSGGTAFTDNLDPLVVSLAAAGYALAEPCVYRDVSAAQAATIAANLAAGRSPMAQAVTPAFYTRFGSGATETSLVGSYSATVPSNSLAVAGPAVDAPPGPPACPVLLLLA